MHAFFYVFFAALLEPSLRAIAKPVAIADDQLFPPTDYDLFAGDDGALLKTGDDSDLFASTDDFGDLSGAESTCSGDISLGEGGDSTFGLDTLDNLVLRDLDDQSTDTLFAAGTECTARRRNKTPEVEPKVELPQLAAPPETQTAEKKCRDNTRPVNACCAKRNGIYPWQCSDGMLFSSMVVHKNK